MVHVIAYMYVQKTSSSDDWLFWKNIPRAKWWFVPFIMLVLFVAIFVVQSIFERLAIFSLIVASSGWLTHRQYQYLKPKCRLVQIWSSSQFLAALLLAAGIYFVFFAC
jgi:hypothetical protein